MGWSYVTAPNTMGSSIDPRADENPETFDKDTKKQQEFVKMWMEIEKDFIVKTFSTAWNKTLTFNLFYNQSIEK